MIFGGQYYLVTLRTLDKSIHHSGPNEKGCSAARIRGSPKSSNPRGSHHPGPASTRVSSPRPATRATRQGTRRPRGLPTRCGGCSTAHPTCVCPSCCWSSTATSADIFRRRGGCLCDSHEGHTSRVISPSTGSCYVLVQVQLISPWLTWRTRMWMWRRRRTFPP